VFDVFEKMNIMTADVKRQRVIRFALSLKQKRNNRVAYSANSLTHTDIQDNKLN